MPNLTTAALGTVILAYLAYAFGEPILALILCGLLCLIGIAAIFKEWNS